MKNPGSRSNAGVKHSFLSNPDLSLHGLWLLCSMILLSLVKVCNVYQQLLTQMNLRSGCFSTEAIWDKCGHAKAENHLHSLQKYPRGSYWLSSLLHSPSWKAACQYLHQWDDTL